MPFKSQSQRKLFWAKVGRGEISRKTAEEWEKHTPRRKLPEHVKKSQLGGQQAGAVSMNTPTVQASQPMNAPTATPASMTVTKTGQVKYAAWADEFEKIAVSKWKAVMRAGGLGAGELSRLQQATIPRAIRVGRGAAAQVQKLESGGSPLLDYSRNITGLRRGSYEQAAKKGLKITEHKTDPQRYVSNIKDTIESLKRGNLGDAYAGAREAIKETPTMMAGTVAGGGMALPGKRIVLAPEQNVIASQAGLERGSQERRGVLAITKRHEVDEQLEKMRQAAAGQRVGWTPYRDPPANLRQAWAKAEKHPLLRGMRAAMGVPERVLGAYQRGAGKILGPESRVTKTLGSAAEKARLMRLSGSVPAGKMPAGKHLTPGVITRESANLAMMPEGTRKAFQDIRAGAEPQMLAPYGLEYGLAPSPQTHRKIMRAFNRGEL